MKLVLPFKVDLLSGYLVFSVLEGILTSPFFCFSGMKEILLETGEKVDGDKKNTGSKI